ncbi:MAG: UvrD-helicase domain-containing protein [Ignavibacteria bacterium]|nr:UvrD-helicase domain-containing protein [Ignavibacteria bacterium]
MLRQKLLKFPDDVLLVPQMDFPNLELAEQVCELYQSYKASLNVMDYDDILTIAYNELRSEPKDRAMAEFESIQVDEVQDLESIAMGNN